MEEKNYEISVSQIFGVALKHWWVILIAVVLGVAIAFCYVSFFVTPQYTSTARVGVKNFNMTAYQDVLLGETISKDLEMIIKSNTALEMAAKSLNESEYAQSAGKTYTWSMLSSMLKTSPSGESRYINVEVVSTVPKEAKIVCEHVLDAFCDYLTNEDPLNGARGNVIHVPEEATSPSSPNKMLTMVLGALIGFVLSFGVLLIRYFSKDALDGEDWLVESYKDKIPMLAVIPDSESSGKKYREYSSKYGYGYNNY